MAAGEFSELPEALIQLIQSFLPTKEAARTSILSQSWLSAWLTRTKLDFDRNDFRQNSDRDATDSLLEFANKSIRRHKLWDLTIESFSLRDIGVCGDSQYRNLILRALKLGATRLTVHLSCSLFQLPNEVFASENLVALTAKLCKVDLCTVGCSSLRSLTFELVAIESPDALFRLLLGCPLIEKLSLSHIIMPAGGGGMIALHRLTCLVLDHSGLDTLFLNALSSKFPSLKDLSLRMLIEEARQEMLISSPSLERLHFNFNRFTCGCNKIMRLKFDLPRICKLTFEATIASVGITNGWESDVSVTHHHHHLTANNIDFLGLTLLQGLDVRITNLIQLAFDGLNDLKEARAQIFYRPAFMWMDVPRLDDSTIPKDYQLEDVRFYMIWQPKQKKLN